MWVAIDHNTSFCIHSSNRFHTESLWHPLTRIMTTHRNIAPPFQGEPFIIGTHFCVQTWYINNHSTGRTNISPSSWSEDFAGYIPYMKNNEASMGISSTNELPPFVPWQKGYLPFFETNDFVSWQFCWPLRKKHCEKNGGKSLGILHVVYSEGGRVDIRQRWGMFVGGQLVLIANC